MKAVAISEFDAVPAVVDVEARQPGDGEVLVDVEYASVNGMDFMKANGMMAQMMPHEFPVTLGCDFAGTIAAVGDGVTDLAVGDHVALVFVPSCGHCMPCSEGRPALCEPGAAANGAGTLLDSTGLFHQFKADLGAFAEINDAYAAFFGADPPARVAVGVAALPKGVQVEIEAIVAVD